jgi:hypothetical protein
MKKLAKSKYTIKSVHYLCHLPFLILKSLFQIHIQPEFSCLRRFLIPSVRQPKSIAK